MISERTGKILDWLQGESAYPNGPLPAAVCHVERAAALGMLPAKGGPHAALVIGPGTQAEVDALARHTGNTPIALTACASESYLFERGDMHDMPFATGVFDFVFTNNVMEHALAPYVALLEIRRVLRTDGIFYMIVPTFETPGGDATPWHLYCLDEKHWRSLLQKTGFVVERVERTKEAIGSATHFEHYMHFRARAGALSHPHSALLERLSVAKLTRDV